MQLLSFTSFAFLLIFEAHEYTKVFKIYLEYIDIFGWNVLK